MTREEAIEILRGAIKKPNTKDGYLGQAIDLAIKALEQEPILDKISSEIEQLPTSYIEILRPHSVVERDVVELGAVLRIIDKYKKGRK